VRPSLFLALLLLAGCTQTIIPEPSQAIDPASTRLGLQLAELASSQPQGTSGYRLLASSTEAFLARAESIRAAQSSIDLQYYIVHDGLSTRLLTEELLKAADRGVRVRILLDDTTSDGRDQQIAVIAAHPNIEIRVFNPLHAGRSTSITRGLGRLLNLSRQHRRMHNKLWLVDSSVAIVGGRNLGDEYFDARTDLNFTDIDLLVAGPVAADLAQSFDQYWNHSLSKPIQNFLHSSPDRQALEETRERLRLELAELDGSEDEHHLRLTRFQREPKLQQWLTSLIWAHGQALWDAPAKLLADGEPDPQWLLTTQLAPALDAVERELMLISAYFVPTDDGLTYLTGLADRQIDVHILTNSLEATDVPAVHGGYAPYRRALLEHGVKLYELRRQPDEEPSYSYSGDSESSLHSKAVVFDGTRVFLGSLNLDPRSVLWNSEVGILVDSEELSAEVRRLTLEGMAPALSYQVRLQQREGITRMVWVAESEGQELVLEKEPGGAWRHFNAWLARVVGLETML